MALRERMQYLLELDVKGFVRGADEAGEAFDENFGDDKLDKFDKLKQRGQVTFAGMKANAAEFAVAAGASIAAFGVKAVKDFTDTALAAGAFADMTDLSVEASSRWLDVVDRYGVELGDLQDVFNNVAAKIAEGDDVFRDLGVTIARTSGGAVDLDESMRRVIEAMEGVEDPAERARIAAELFGEEGARQFAELIARGGDLRTMLESVGDAQVIDDAELAKAREMRETMQELQRKLSDVALTIGEYLVPAAVKAVEGIEAIGSAMDALGIDDLLDAVAGDAGEVESAMSGLIASFEAGEASGADLANAFKAVVEGEQEATGALEAAGGLLSFLNKPWEDHKLEIDSVTDAFSRLAERSPEAAGGVFNAMQAVLTAAENGNEAAKTWVDQWGLSNDVLDTFKTTLYDAATAQGVQTESTHASAAATEEAAEAARKAAERTANYAHADTILNRELEALDGNLDDATDATEDLTDATEDAVDAAENLTNQFNLMRDAIDNEEAYLDIVDAFQRLEDAEPGTRSQERAVNDLKREVIDFAEEVGGIPASKVTEINALIDAGDIEAAEAELAKLERARVVKLRVETSTSGIEFGKFRGFAKGTNSAPKGLAVVGEEGPELVEFSGGEKVHTASETRRMRASKANPASAAPTIVVNNTIDAHVITEQGAAEVIRLAGSELPEIVAEAIRQHERLNGPRVA